MDRPARSQQFRTGCSSHSIEALEISGVALVIWTCFLYLDTVASPASVTLAGVVLVGRTELDVKLASGLEGGDSGEGP